MAHSRSRSPRERGLRHATHTHNSTAQYRDRRRRHSPEGRRERDYKAYDRGRAHSYRGTSGSLQDERPVYRRGSRSPGANDRSRSVSAHRRRSFRPITDESNKSKVTEESSSKAVARDSVAEQDTATESNDIAAMMGFGGFGSTKGDKVNGNDAGAVAKAPKRVEYRQYMNRPGGFNRPLDN